MIPEYRQYVQFRMTSKDLELTLDKVPIEYPALVKEAFLNNWHASVHRTEVSSNCASLNEKYCWVLSRNQMFIWEKIKPTGHRTLIPTQLPLPTSGLPRSAKLVVVYDGVKRGANQTQSPGVLVISPEGVLRHWISIASQNYVEKILDINSEVALRVELVDEPANGASASFLLTTTSGTVYFLNGEGPDSGKTGALGLHRVTGREAHRFRRRLSSVLFGGVSKESTSLVTNSFQYQSKELLVVAVSPDVLTVYNMLTPCELWSLKTKDFFQPMVADFFEADLKKVPMMVRVRLIDAAVFREGLMVLMGGTHEESQTVHMFIIWLGPEWQSEVPTKSKWSAKIPNTEHRALFSKADESIYSSLTLCIPKNTAEAKTAERTDGIIVLNPFFTISLYVSFNLENQKKTDVSGYKVCNLPANDQLLGYAVCDQYVYVMFLESGISTIRLLPKGFADGNLLYTQDHVVVPSVAAGADDWTVLSELLSEMVASGLPKSPVLQGLHKAFELFGEKDMAKSAIELQPLTKLADTEMVKNIQMFMMAIIDYSDAANKTETELHAKRVLTARMLLFLQHMGLFEKTVTTLIPRPTHGNWQRIGGAMLAEMSERVAATSAVWTWRNTNETNASIFDAIIEKILRIPEVQDVGLKDKDALFGRCGLVHLIPVMAAKQLDAAVLSKAKTHKFDVFHSVCDLLTGIKEAILNHRNFRTKVSIPKQPGAGWWTIDTFINCYKDVSERIVEELREGNSSDSERTRLLIYILGIYDFYMGEVDMRHESDKILQDLISLGKIPDALDLAEKHRDFGTLVKNYLMMEKESRQKTFERYKKLFRKEDFEMYLCEYLKRHGRNDVLLEQVGTRVDAYLDNFKELRYSREITNKQYGKAALTLMSLADKETKSFSRFADYLTRAHYCASANPPDSTVDVSEVFDFYKRRLPEMTHRKRIPEEIIKSGYGSDLDVMMSVEEMLEWNMAHQPNDQATIEGFARAFHLLADLVEAHEPSEELKAKVNKTWKALIDYDEWNRIRTREDVEKKTMFGKFCNYLISSFPALKGDAFPAWTPASRMLILPSDMESVLDDATANTTGNHTSWIKGHVKWIGEQLAQQSRLPKTAFFRPDSENVGSITAAVLEGFGPILQRREQRYINKLDAHSSRA